MGPLQIIFSFEGLVNGVTSHDDVMKSCQPRVYDLSNFEKRVHHELAKLKELGICGVIVNYGYIDYLDSEEGWQRFIAGIRAAVELGLRIWIYDEKGYPSGLAGGKVLAGHPELEAIGMKKMTVERPENSMSITIPDSKAALFAAHGVHPDGSQRQLPIEKGGRSVKVPDGGFSAVDIYFIAPLYEGTHAAGNLAVARRYINVLNRKAVNRFLQLTHMRYFERIPPVLRRNVDAFFTDEVSLMAHSIGNTVASVQEDPVNMEMPQFPSVPWCAELEAEFLNEHGYVLERHIPALFTGQGKQERKIRGDFWNTVSRLYASIFSEQAADICAALGIDYSGHLLAEETILQQVVLHGDLIQVLKHFHRPGIDLLTCRIDLFDNHLLAHKTALSASFFGFRKGVLSETSDYFECWTGDKTGASVKDIKCILALQYLLGVRDFCFLFLIHKFTPEEYRGICDFTSRMLEIGKGREYQPEVALYYPIEYVWERYVPVCPVEDLYAAGIYGKRINLQSEELDKICWLTTKTVKRLFYANVQYVLCERGDIGHLPDRGIKTILYYGPGKPEPELLNLCSEVGIECLELDDFEKSYRKKIRWQAGKNVVYATYKEFIFAVNTGRDSSFISFPGTAEAVFPMEGLERKKVCDKISLEPFECVYLI